MVSINQAHGTSISRFPRISQFMVSRRSSARRVTNFKVTVDLLNAMNHANWDEGYNNSGIDFGTINKGPSGPTNLPRYLQLSAKLNW